MLIQITIMQVTQKINNLKKKHGRLISNIILYKWDKNMLVDTVETERGIAFVVKEAYRNCLYFACVKESDIGYLLGEIGSNVVLEYISPELEDFPLDIVFEDGGFEKYAIYRRWTMTYSENPYSKPEEGKRGILYKFYNPEQREFAMIKDAKEILSIQREVFDELTDDIYTLEEWKKIIEQKRCLVARENGRIIAYHVFRPEGKKLYSNISVNLGSAEVLYNLERSVVEEYWAKGIRTFYDWVNMDNVCAMKRGIPKFQEFIKTSQIIYNQIYYKK